ncbi:TetR/AcrR family transcriptional regulator [Nocardioides massiliensis]|uniref:AcrR family transcriptional regulator n=1 Tax=Nocardioides massiliensis TaxID=1325935 RepID=A0ABT9NVH8_9ACTN|nr:TetR/AcrR family transcriptional regulator [Nocardioides massiliensis]MDP9824010.1 AcrR family transcriptional regulator [Nocardioides massiliensis]
MADPKPTLRERQRQATRAQVQEAALELFAEHGYESVTMEQIASAAGVSLSTLFRHSPSKEHLLVGAAQLDTHHVVRHLRERPDDEAPFDALAHAILGRTAEFAGAGRVVQTWRRAIAKAPDQLQRVSVLSAAERRELTELIAGRMGLDPARDLTPGVYVAVAAAASEQAFEHWLTTDDSLTLHELCRQALLVTGLCSDGALDEGDPDL